MPQRAHDVAHVNGIDRQVAIPQELHLLLGVLVHSADNDAWCNS
jgi:hypothetical protein